MLKPLLFEYSPAQPRPRKFVVFDRDGTLTQDAGYTYRTRDLQWMPDALNLLAILEEARVPAFVATNQSGVARGYYSIAQMCKFHALMVEEARNYGGNINAVAVCPHLEDATLVQFSGKCGCRKPEAGLLVLLALRYRLAWANGLVVGDKDSDLEAARRVGGAAVDVRRHGWVQQVLRWIRTE